MTVYREAIRQALDDGYLVAQSGTTWLTCEVAWRRHCIARQEPAVVVSCREKFADVYMLLNKVPHRDLAEPKLEGILGELESRGVPESHINVQRGTKGAPELFMGLSIADISIDDAVALAPYLRRQGETLVRQPKAPAELTRATS
jgi:hypothetical protein